MFFSRDLFFCPVKVLIQLVYGLSKALHSVNNLDTTLLPPSGETVAGKPLLGILFNKLKQDKIWSNLPIFIFFCAAERTFVLNLKC